MPKRLLLVLLLVASLGMSGVALWKVTRPSVADGLTDNADSLLHQWKVPDITNPSTTPQPNVTKPSKTDTTTTQPSTTIVQDVQETKPAASSKFGVIRIPAMNLKFPIVEGTAEHTDLVRGVGHYVDTALPGEIGNVAIAGHVCCASNGQPFRKLKTLNSGDLVYIDTKKATYIYSVVDNTACGSSPMTVPMTRVEVINPNPCSTSIPTRRLLTLQTCTDWNGAPATRRVIVWAELKSVNPRS